MPDKIKQQYHIVEILKESENKNVFLLEDSDGNRTVLKQYHKEYEQFSKNEYEILRTLQKTSNPCFPKPVDYFVQDEYAYILREYVEGDSLLNLYENGQLESEEKVLRLSIMMCRVLSILHEQKPLMIHRDVKPENFVFQAKQNRLSLIDCDSVRFYKNGQEHDTLFFGTPTHAAPEAYGYCQCDVRSDVFGLGKTILFLCCGRADDLAVEECNLSKELLVIIKKCIAFSPQERYSKVVHIEQELKKLYDRKYHKASKSFKITYVLGTFAAVILAFFAGMSFYKNYEERSSVETNKTDAVASNHTFSGCSKLTKVTIPDTVTKIGKSAFKDCVSLKRIFIPENVVTIGAKAFYNCKKLSRIIFAGTKIKKIGKKAFAGIAKNSIIAVPENKKKAYMKLLKNGGYKKSVK